MPAAVAYVRDAYCICMHGVPDTRWDIAHDVSDMAMYLAFVEDLASALRRPMLFFARSQNA